MPELHEMRTAFYEVPQRNFEEMLGRCDPCALAEQSGSTFEQAVREESEQTYRFPETVAEALENYHV